MLSEKCQSFLSNLMALQNQSSGPFPQTLLKIFRNSKTVLTVVCTSVCLPEVWFRYSHFPTAAISMTSDVTWYCSFITRSWWILYSPPCYYAVEYDKTFYFGWALESLDSDCEFPQFKFLHSTVLNGEKLFDWPKRDDKEKVQSSRVIYGPVVMVGLRPFTIWVKL